LQRNAGRDHDVVYAASTTEFHHNPAVVIFHERAEVSGDVRALALFQNVDLIQEFILFLLDWDDFDRNERAPDDVAVKGILDCLSFVNRTIRAFPQLLKQLEVKSWIFRGVLRTCTDRENGKFWVSKGAKPRCSTCQSHRHEPVTYRQPKKFLQRKREFIRSLGCVLQGISFAHC